MTAEATARCACWWPTTRRSRASACCACSAAMPDVEVAGECADAHEVLAAGARGRRRCRAARHPDARAVGHRGAAAVPGGRAGRDLLHRAHRARRRGVRRRRDRLPAEANRRRAPAAARSNGRASATRAGATGRSWRGCRASAQAAAPLGRLALPTRQGIVLLDPADVSHAALDGELVTVHTAAGTYLSALSLQELEARLPGEQFARVHRRALVNLEHVTRLEPNEIGGFVLRSAPARSSRSRGRPRAICASAWACAARVKARDEPLDSAVR